jgi:predicted anti-sigma-YlaC factor YlaD
MSCRDTIHLICWYLEGRLSSPVEGEIKRHLEGCSDCRMVLEAAVNTLERYFTSERAPATPESAAHAA